jgi:hypothetical protein
MATRTRTTAHHARTSVAETIRQRIEAGQERFWRHSDFESLPPAAVSQTLARLTRQNYLQRISKGLYYRSRPTVFGRSRPSVAAIHRLPIPHKPVFPAGIAAANLLGFTTQNTARIELATPATSLPRTIIGSDTLVHTRRPAAWSTLTAEEAALLDFIRQRAKASELSPEETIARLLRYFAEGDRFARIARVAMTEPPRVRAILGAIGQQLGQDPQSLEALRSSLNPLSRFDFGILNGLEYARQWQAKPRTAR